MSTPSLLDKALRAAGRILSANANRRYRDLLSLYSTKLLGEMVAQSEQPSSSDYLSSESNEPYRFEKVIDLVTHHFPLSECIRSMQTYVILDEIRDIAWEIEGCVIETITFMVNDLEVSPYTIRHYSDLPSIVQLQVQKHLDDQLTDLGLPLEHVSVVPFIKGLLANRWELFTTTFESPSLPTMNLIF